MSSALARQSTVVVVTVRSGRQLVPLSCFLLALPTSTSAHWASDERRSAWKVACACFHDQSCGEGVRRV